MDNYTDKEDGIWLQNVECFDCGSKDNLSIYEKPDGTVDGFCQTPRCGEGRGYKQYKSHNRLAVSYLGAELGIKKITSKTTSSRTRSTNKNEESKVISRGKKKKEKKPLTKEEVAAIAKKTSAKGGGFRKQCDKELAELMVRTEYNEDGSVKNRYYPIWKKSISKYPVGFKKRIVLPEKDFSVIGLNDPTVDLFGEDLCTPKKDSYLLLESGEEDVIAARKMIKMWRKSKNKNIDVVCSSHSETAQYKQIQAKYDFFNSYQTIVIAMDEDEAGREATEKLLDILPIGKVKVMSKSNGDANDCLRKGLGEQWLFDFYGADRPNIAGITGSSTIFDGIVENASKKKIPLPDFLNRVNDMLEGGLSMNTFNIIAAHTSIGKSTVTNELLYHLVMNMQDKAGVISLEASKNVLGEQLLSLHLKKRISSISDEKEKVEFLLENKDKAEELLKTEDGEDRFYIMDDRSYLSNPDEVFNNIDKLIRGLGVKLIIIDVLSDLMDNLNINEQAEFMGRIKKVIAANEVIIIGIMHMRKDMTGKDSNPHAINEHSIYGSSTAIKSASTVLLMSRDKLAEDEEERNTTRVTLTKNRGNGITGKCCELYYDYKKHKLYDKDDWVESQIEDL